MTRLKADKEKEKELQTDNVKKSAVSLWQVVHKSGDFFLMNS
jgi:hypothetical protein